MFRNCAYLFLIFCFQLGFGQISFQEQIITSNADYATGVYAADLNGDGTKDIISCSLIDRTVAWYSNLDGFGNFSSAIVLDDDIFKIGQVRAGDVDGDGDNDIFHVGSYTTNDTEIHWFENLDGLGTFSPKMLIASNTYFARSFILEDIDADGDLDIITPTAWFRNLDGNGTFSEGIFIQSSITSGTPRSVATGDFDLDGDLDLVVVRGGRTIWFENVDGQGTFTSSFSYPLIGQYAELTDVFVTDFNSDGNPDIVVCNQNSSGSRIVTYINSGNADFNWPETIFTGPQQYTLFASDINSDNSVDVIAANYSVINWYDNAQGFSQEPVSSNSLDNIQDIFVTDIDNDGDFDILSAWADDDSIVLHKNMGELGNEIQGTVSLNIPTTNCAPDNPIISSILVTSTDGATNTFATFTQSNGNYQIPVNIGGFITEVDFPNNYSSIPGSNFTEFLDQGNTEIANFCIEPTATANDINITIYPSIDEPRPGFDTTFHLVYSNSGTTQISGDVQFEFDNSKIQFLSASQMVASQSINTLAFSFTDLQPLETRFIDLEFNVFPPPTTNIDDVLVSTATINPIAGDETEEDNVFELEQTVIGSYDPNDITCLQGEEVFIEDANKFLNYLIRFQNTGTASAINVRVEHILDDKLDWSTMQLESLSHSGRVEIENGTDISFIFNDINLPDSTNDEPNSHGYIAFKIKPKQDVVVGDIISGVADIYFDFNPPIVTNTATTEFVEPLSTNDYEVQSFQIYPIPVIDKITVSGKSEIDTIAIFDINGRSLNQQFSIKNYNQDTILDVSQLKSGIYFIELQSGNSKQTTKFIKK